MIFVFHSLRLKLNEHALQKKYLNFPYQNNLDFMLKSDRSWGRCTAARTPHLFRMGTLPLSLIKETLNLRSSPWFLVGLRPLVSSVLLDRVEAEDRWIGRTPIELIRLRRCKDGGDLPQQGCLSVSSCMASKRVVTAMWAGGCGGRHGGWESGRKHRAGMDRSCRRCHRTIGDTNSIGWLAEVYFLVRLALRGARNAS
jgi:hypothetical protein